MIIAVGSQNPVKIKAVQDVVNKIWKDAEVLSINADSKVSDQPHSEEEAILGATNRAKQALLEGNADLGIGIEGYNIDKKQGTFVAGLSVAIDKRGEIGYGYSGKILLPQKVAEAVKKGKELGDVMNELTEIENVKQKQGAAGIFTKGIISRKTALEMAVVYSLTKFIVPEYYQ